jgi:hypothetical protein
MIFFPVGKQQVRTVVRGLLFLIPIYFSSAKNRAIISAISFHFTLSRAIPSRPIGVSA